MKEFSLLIKPASADCNLRCEYCFYLDTCRLYPQEPRHRMSDEVLERMVESYLATEQPVYSFGWQGGEPTLMGLDFFKRVVELQEKHGRPGSSVANGLQTNATLVDIDMAKHFGEYCFLLGCSLDGPAEIHDRYRLNAEEKPSHGAVIRGLDVLTANKVEFNILVLVSQANVHRAREVYRYLLDKGFHYQQYIPCVEFDEKGTLLPFAINGREWGNFLCALFDEWRKKDTYKVSIRHFDSILFKMVEGIDNVCVLGRDCRKYFVVEYNGDIYPCDFFVEKSLKLGNVRDTSWEEAFNSRIFKNFGAQKPMWNTACDKCDSLDLCAGDCLKHRIYAGNSPRHLSFLCEGWKRFLRHSRPCFQELSAEIRKRRIEEERQSPSRVDRNQRRKPVGRNAPCPCGSGLKYKKCCGKN
ncbi:MAG: anaerobic sulfatase maturase [Proteobacteria bacterium]|nr:anaerobic sulfatase maturase [Pseudomonadota bacterium]